MSPSATAPANQPEIDPVERVAAVMVWLIMQVIRKHPLLRFLPPLRWKIERYLRQILIRLAEIRANPLPAAPVAPAPPPAAAAPAPMPAPRPNTAPSPRRAARQAALRAPRAAPTPLVPLCAPHPPAAPAALCRAPASPSPHRAPNSTCPRAQAAAPGCKKSPPDPTGFCTPISLRYQN